MPHEYGGGGQHGHPHGQAAMMFNPFMMQHPLMVHPQQQQHHASPWGAASMMQQQVGVRTVQSGAGVAACCGLVG